MLEYVFFDEGIREKFAEFVRGHGLECRFSDEDGLIALIPEDMDDEVSDAIDQCYELLLQETAELLEEETVEKSAAGVMVQLSDGTPCQVRLDPNLMARLLGCLSLEELRDFVQEVALAVENPDAGPICHSPNQNK